METIYILNPKKAHSIKSIVKISTEDCMGGKVLRNNRNYQGTLLLPSKKGDWDYESGDEKIYGFATLEKASKFLIDKIQNENLKIIDKATTNKIRFTENIENLHSLLNNIENEDERKRIERKLIFDFKNSVNGNSRACSIDITYGDISRED